jgi:uncharacterized protein (TIGR03437 family)
VTLGGAQGFVLLAAKPLSAVLNAASLTAGPVSPGELVTIPGSNSGAAPTVLFNGVSAPIVAAVPNQINAVVPFALDVSHAAQVEIKQDQSDTTISTPAAAASPAIFTLSSTGTGPGAILNQDGSVNSASNPAVQGSWIVIYGTGFGALSSPPTDGAIAQIAVTTAAPVTATVAGAAADVLYAGAAPGLVAGVVQVNIRVPSGLTSSAAAPITLSTGSFTTPAGVTVAIQ